MEIRSRYTSKNATFGSAARDQWIGTLSWRRNSCPFKYHRNARRGEHDARVRHSFENQLSLHLARSPRHAGSPVGNLVVRVKMTRRKTSQIITILYHFTDRSKIARVIIGGDDGPPGEWDLRSSLSTVR